MTVNRLSGRFLSLVLWYNEYMPDANKAPKVVIAIATGGTIRIETMTSLYSNLINLAEQNIPPNLLCQVGGYKDINCNVLVDNAKKEGMSHIMFVDTDMIFPEDGIARLLAHDKDIVGANYNVRLDPTSGEFSGPTVKMLVDGKPVSMLAEGFPTDLFKCYALPLGFMLVKMSVFDKLKRPYFESHIYNDKHMTEDIDFCIKANEAGIDVWCDPTIKIGHIGSYVY